MGKQGVLDLATGGTGMCASEYGDGYVAWCKGSSPLAGWERRFLEETARIEEDYKSLPDELAPCDGSAFKARGVRAKVMANAAEAGARLVALMPGAKTQTEMAPWATGSISSRRTSPVERLERRL